MHFLSIIWDILSSPRNGIEWMLCILMWIIVLFFVFMLGVGVFSLIKKLFYVITLTYDEEKFDAEVVNREYSGPYTSTYYIKSGNVMVPITQHHDASYAVVIKTKGHSKLIDTIHDEDFYHLAHIGHPVSVIMKVGRDKSDTPKDWRILRYSY